jgi:nicotinamidase-related amidase
MISADEIAALQQQIESYFFKLEFTLFWYFFCSFAHTKIENQNAEIWRYSAFYDSEINEALQSESSYDESIDELYFSRCCWWGVERTTSKNTH